MSSPAHDLSQDFKASSDRNRSTAGLRSMTDPRQAGHDSRARASGGLLHPVDPRATVQQLAAPLIMERTDAVCHSDNDVEGRTMRSKQNFYKAEMCLVTSISSFFQFVNRAKVVHGQAKLLRYLKKIIYPFECYSHWDINFRLQIKFALATFHVGS